MQTKSLFAFLLFMLLAPISLPSIVRAGFDSNNVISDHDYQDWSSMSRDQIQNFLSEKGGELANLDLGDGKKAADVFTAAASEYRISPKLLMTVAENEQSGITDDSLSEGQIKYLMGYGWDDPDFFGVENQVLNAARQFRRYLDKSAYYTFKAGKTSTTTDGFDVTPVNAGTAGIYNYIYTISGVEKFYFVWNSWFEESTSQDYVYDPKRYWPNGTLLREKGTSGVFMIRNGIKYPFWSRGVFDARGYELSEVIDVDKSELDQFKAVTPMLYPNGKLIRSPKGTVYIVDQGKRRGFASREAFDRLGYRMEQVIPTRWGEVNLYPEGEKITVDSDFHVNGTLIKTANNPSVYQVWDGKRKPFVDLKIFDKSYFWSDVIVVPAEQMSWYQEGEPVKFRDGSLLLAHGAIHVIEDGERRHIGNIDIFKKYGFKMENVIEVNDSALNIHRPKEALH